ncbi:hypothetical protein [Nocardia sp. NPDC052566]|uniref:hypothetical protein n=1 Tax=Nocardia sp. NPDC052566 TaxID=3364330 RepID=UPI0037CCAB02
MARGRVAPDDDLFAEDPGRGDAEKESWGDEEWDEVVDDSVVDRADVEEFGDEFAEEFSRPAEFTQDLSILTAAPDAAASAPQRDTVSSRKILVAVGAAAVAIGVGVTVVVGRDDPPSQLPRRTDSAAMATTPSPSSTAPPMLTGSGRGDLTSGPGVIFGFEHAYYVSRDGKTAAEFLVPEQNTPAVAASIQQAIDDLDKSLTHSVTVTTTSNPNVFNVVLTLNASDGKPYALRQQFTVVSRDGRYYLVSKQECGAQVCPTS